MTLKNAIVSIIIPTYNRAHLIGETLDSVLSQTWPNWECLVIDDGSTDYTAELLEFYCEKNKRISFLHRPENRPKGANTCRNYGFELSKGKYINWFDSDDIMHPEKLEFQLNSLENSDFSYSICKTLIFKKSVSNPIGLQSEEIVSSRPKLDYLTMKIGWLTQAPLWKKEFLKNFEELFDEDLKAAQEWEFHVRMLHTESEYAVVNKVLVYTRYHGNSISYNDDDETRSFHYFYARLKIYRKLNDHLCESALQFLRSYLINSFKKMIIKRNFKSVKAYRLFLLPERGISIRSKFYAFWAISGYLMINRGNWMLQQISYNR